MKKVKKGDNFKVQFSQPAMILEGLDCTIERVYGRFLVVHTNSDKATLLVELGTQDYSKILTTLKLN
jgi:hypothetical protein